MADFAGSTRTLHPEFQAEEEIGRWAVERQRTGKHHLAIVEVSPPCFRRIAKRLAARIEVIDGVERIKMHTMSGEIDVRPAHDCDDDTARIA